MEWSDEARSKSHNGCTTPILTCSPQSNATSLKTPNLPPKQGNNYGPSNNNNNNNNNNNGANYPSQYDSSLLMTSHPAYNDAPSLQQQQQQQNHLQRKQQQQQQFTTPSSPLSPALLSPFSPPVFSTGELHHGDQSFPSTPPAYQSPEKRSCVPVTNGILQQQQQQQQQKRKSNGTTTGEESKLKQIGDGEVLSSSSSSSSSTATTSSTTTTKASAATAASNGVEAKMCAACERSISDRYLLFTADRYWHLDCLRCSSCNVALAEVGTTCFSRSGMTLCRSDYIRMFGSTGICTSCRQTIPANDYVMRTSQGSVYHVTCFCCVRCHRTLVPGDKYGILHGNLLCENDYWVAMTTGQNSLPYNDIQAPPPTSQQQQQQHHHLPHPPAASHHHHHHHHPQQQQQQQQQFRGCPQPMMNGKGLPEDHRHHHHHPLPPPPPHHQQQQQQQQQQPPPQQQQHQQQHLNQMRFSHKVG